MAVKKPSVSDVLFVLFLLLLVLPQTRKPIVVGLNKVKVWAFSPGLEDKEDQITLSSFDYYVSDMTGNTSKISVGGTKVVFLSYWATWCAPCIAELPSIQKLYESYGDHIEFVLLTKEDPLVVTRFLEEEGFTLPVYNPKMKVPTELNDRQLPTSYLINGNGKILIEQTGAANWNAIKIRQLLDELLDAQIAGQL